MRVTDKVLQWKIDRINELSNSPMETWKEGEKKFIANIGNYCTSSAYGGVKLERIMNEGGGVTSVSNDGFGTKKQLASFLDGMIAGLVAQEVQI